MPLGSKDIARADDLPRRLAASLALAPASAREGERFAPELSYGRHFGPAPHDARGAAVIALLFQRSGEWHIPLTVRPPALSKHGGQISLPGGAIDAGETPAEAARRELFEELGVGEAVDLLGELSETYVYVSNFRVTPWLAATSACPSWCPHDLEVHRVIEMPLCTLLDPGSVGSFTVERGPVRLQAPCIRVGDDCVWGATSIILGQLAGVLRRIVDADG